MGKRKASKIAPPGNVRPQCDVWLTAKPVKKGRNFPSVDQEDVSISHPTSQNWAGSFDFKLNTQQSPKQKVLSREPLSIIRSSPLQDALVSMATKQTALTDFFKAHRDVRADVCPQREIIPQLEAADIPQRGSVTALQTRKWYSVDNVKMRRNPEADATRDKKPLLEKPTLNQSDTDTQPVADGWTAVESDKENNAIEHQSQMQSGYPGFHFKPLRCCPDKEGQSRHEGVTPLPESVDDLSNDLPYQSQSLDTQSPSAPSSSPPLMEQSCWTTFAAAGPDSLQESSPKYSSLKSPRFNEPSDSCDQQTTSLGYSAPKDTESQSSFGMDKLKYVDLDQFETAPMPLSEAEPTDNGHTHLLRTAEPVFGSRSRFVNSDLWEVDGMSVSTQSSERLSERNVAHGGTMEDQSPEDSLAFTVGKQGCLVLKGPTMPTNKDLWIEEESQSYDW